MTKDKLMFELIQQDTRINRAFLRQGVQKQACVAAGTLEVVSDLLSPPAFDALLRIIDGLFADEALGTVELYANGAFNAYRKRGGRVTGFYIYRPEPFDLLVVNGELLEESSDE